jgi:hypothetical protein
MRRSMMHMESFDKRVELLRVLQEVLAASSCIYLSGAEQQMRVNDA